MARAALRLLQHGLHTQRLNCGSHVLGLMAYDRDNFARFERLAGTHYIFDQRTPARAMEHLRE